MIEKECGEKLDPIWAQIQTQKWIRALWMKDILCFVRKYRKKCLRANESSARSNLHEKAAEEISIG